MCACELCFKGDQKPTQMATQSAIVSQGNSEVETDGEELVEISDEECDVIPSNQSPQVAATASQDPLQMTDTKSVPENLNRKSQAELIEMAFAGKFISSLEPSAVFLVYYQCVSFICVIH